MGLDMYLYATLYTSEYSNKELNIKLREQFKDVPTKNMDSIELKFNVGYWRKANAIHKWFVGLDDDKDECQTIYVSRANLRELLKLVNIILEDNSKAESLLPCESGFFFGNTEYNEYYFEDLKDTKKIIEDALKMSKDYEFEYKASW